MDKKNSGFCFQYFVEKTTDKGLGVFAGEAIKQGSIVWRHVQGQYIVYDEQTFKSAIRRKSHAEVLYELTHVFGLADFPSCLIRVFDDGVLVNHSSNANLATNDTTGSLPSLDVTPPQYLGNVTKALLNDRYALVATRDIQKGEEFTNDYTAEFVPPYYDVLYEQYGVSEDFLNDC